MGGNDEPQACQRQETLVTEIMSTPEEGDGEPPSKDEKTWGMLCHLAALAGFIGIPFGTIIGPLVVWLVKKNEMLFVDEQGKEALNFQITMASATMVLAMITCSSGGIGAIAVLAVNVIFVIIASIKASGGEHYRYPMTVRLIK
ncbi:MAG: DUF4870 domain-containing protein [Phycisphaeraceae bacterium]|jgi:hypothetical protein|nr:DUF4870 domain-containing protein [Phycisphaeraceae bacterium]MDP7347476.1 DUF4870 domain-containing protein [Phycisphaeraceae bacterium]